MSSPKRLQSILASAGIASRRKAERLIVDGRVRVNGAVVTELGAKADPAADRIEVDGNPLPPPAEHVVIALNKPPGVLTTMHDPRGRQTVADLMPDIPGLHPIGRLDIDTTGLLLVTNDGDLTLAITHPRHGLPKRYRARVKGAFSRQPAERLMRGITLEDGTARATEVRIGRTGPTATEVFITVHEGRNRMVRRMLEAVGHPVERLERTSVGPVDLGDLARGQSRRVEGEELARLREACGLPVTRS
ncbi:MAG: pseudouridine synthase [bacterium]|nr:pseudouridine synthase [bacterium]